MITSKPKSENYDTPATEISRLEIVEWTADKQAKPNSAPSNDLPSRGASVTVDIFDFGTPDTNRERCFMLYQIP
jgi:hypothetical protein